MPTMAPKRKRDIDIQDTSSEDAEPYSGDGSDDNFVPGDDDDDMSSDGADNEVEIAEAKKVKAKKTIVKKPKSKQIKSNKNKKRKTNCDEKMTEDEVKAFVENGLLTPGPPSKRFSAKVWSPGYGMKYLYFANNIELLHWYYCEICGFILNVNLNTSGTNQITGHAEIHRYSLSKQEMSELLAKATAFGNQHGAVSQRSLDDHLPDGQKW